VRPQSLKESLDEIDLGTQFHLGRYSYLFESLLVNDGLTISPILDSADSTTTNDDTTGRRPSQQKSEGLRAIVERIDNSADFKNFMQNYAVTFAASGQKVLRREGPADEGFVHIRKVQTREPANSISSGNLNGSMSGTNTSHSPSLASTSGSNWQTTSTISAQTGTAQGTPQQSSGPMYFGVDLGYQMARDGVDIPKVLEKCTEVIEAYGLDITGIYRLSGTTSRIQRLKAKMEQSER